MDIGTIIKFILFALLLVFSAFFSGSETGIFSLSILEREKLRRKSKGRIIRFLNLIVEKADDTLITILTGNMIVNMFATALYENLLEDRISFENETLALLFPIVSMTLILLLFGELLPKSFAVRNPIQTARFAAFPLLVVYNFLGPIRYVLSKIKRLLSIRLPAKADERDLINATIKIGYKEGIIDQLEYNLFESFFTFNTLTAGDIMIPRTEISGIEISTSIQEVLAQCEQASRYASHSLILVYEENIDNPMGYIEVKDLVPFKFQIGAEKTLSELLRPFHPIPQSKKLGQLMREMKELDTGMALVVDEYGGTAGLCTFKHLVESILGYFYMSDDDRIKAIDRDTFIVPGDLEVKALNEMLHLVYETESRTAGGLVLEKLGEIPQEGSRARIGNVQFTVVKMQKNRIHTLKVEVIP